MPYKKQKQALDKAFQEVRAKIKFAAITKDSDFPSLVEKASEMHQKAHSIIGQNVAMKRFVKSDGVLKSKPEQEDISEVLGMYKSLLSEVDSLSFTYGIDSGERDLLKGVVDDLYAVVTEIYGKNAQLSSRLSWKERVTGGEMGKEETMCHIQDVIGKGNLPSEQVVLCAYYSEVAEREPFSEVALNSLANDLFGRDSYPITDAGLEEGKKAGFLEGDSTGYKLTQEGTEKAQRILRRCAKEADIER